MSKTLFILLLLFLNKNKKQLPRLAVRLHMTSTSIFWNISESIEVTGIQHV